MQIAVLCQDKSCEVSLDFVWWNLNLEQLYSQLNLGFDIVTGTQTVASK
jgi:hypothetical protein